MLLKSYEHPCGDMIEHANVRISGTISADTSKVVDDVKYRVYRSELQFKRLSDKMDGAVLNIKGDAYRNIQKGKKVCIDGSLRTYKQPGGGSQTVILVFNIEDYSQSQEDCNSVDISGRIVNSRMTNNGENVHVCEARIEVLGKYNKMSRITIVGWGMIADKLNSLGVGTEINCEGRLQSRVLRDCDCDETNEILEVAVKKLKVAGEEE